MSFYPPKIEERFGHPKRCGVPEHANATGKGAGFECGAFVRFALQIDEAEAVVSAKYRTNGCGYLIAAAEALAERLEGKALTTLAGFDLETAVEDIEDVLGKFPEIRTHCAAVVIEAVKSALADHRSRRLEEFQGEKALICTCFGVSEETIAKFIEENDLTEVGEVSKLTRAGSGCGACQMLIREIIDVRFD